MTQQQLADLAGWTKSAVSMLETGARTVDSRQRLAQLADALRVSPTDLTSEPYPLDAPGLAEAQVGVPALESALMDFRIGDSSGLEPRSLEDLDAAVHGELADAISAGDYAARLVLSAELITELQAYGPHERAMRLLADVARKSAHGLRHVGQVPLAWIAAERAAQAAALVGDPVLVAAAEFVRASARPAPARAPIHTAAAADRLSEQMGATKPWPQEVYGMLRLSAALSAQRRGDQAEADAQAGEAARVAELHGERPKAWEHFGPANVGVWRTMLAVEAGEPGRALEHAAAVDVSALSRGRRAMLLLETARAHYLFGGAHQPHAVAALREAERLTPVRIRASPWARDMVEVMLTQSRRETGGRELRGLAFRMGLDAG
jgi:transcriptional regulator with XRE-family HTH domain